MMSKPARSIHKKGRKNVIGSFMSAKMQVLVEWESQIERDFMYYLEFDYDVRGYTSQPTRYRYTREDKYKYHFPDFEIFRYSTPKRKFVEIKPLHVTKKTEFIEKTAAIKAQMHTDGFDYSVVTDSQLRVEPILSNLKLLYRYIIHGFYPDFADTSKKPDNGQKECLCRREENTAPSSSMVLLNKPGSRVSVVPRLHMNWVLPLVC